MRTLKLVVGYNGVPYVGSQRQADAPTVEGSLEQAWWGYTGLRERIRLAGRTDAGVSAELQVGFVHTESALDTETLVRGLRANLDANVCVLELAEAAPGFDARRDARWRRYRYQYDGKPAAFVDWRTMDRAARLLCGEHDFSALSGSGPVGPRGHVRTVLQAAVVLAEGGGQLWLTADAFLNQMARRAASALLWVGTGKIAAAELRRALQLRDPSMLPGPAAAEKLTLIEVGYGDFTV